MSMLLLKTICINPWKEEDGEGVHFCDVWVITIAIAIGVKVVWGDARCIFKHLRHICFSFREVGGL